MRSASHGGTRPPCSGKSAVPLRRTTTPILTGSEWGPRARASLPETSTNMRLRPLRPLLLLSAAALAPIALGIAMHLDHVAAAEACSADLAGWTTTPTPTARVEAVVPRALPIPVPLTEPSLDHALPFAHVVDLDGPHVVLATAVEDDWAAGAPEFRSEDARSNRDGSVWRSVAVHELPIAILANVGRTLRVYSAEGEACTARIGAPMLVSEVWGEFEEWGPTEGEPATPMDAWKAGRRTLVAPLATDGECGTPLWGRDVALPAPAVFVRTEGATPRAARKAVFRDPQVREVARELVEFHADTGGDDGSKPPTLAQITTDQRWVDALGRELFTFSIAHDAMGSCGSFDPAWAMFVPTGDAGVIALDREGDEMLAVFDLERDGRIEVLSSTWLGPTRLVEVGGADALRVRSTLDGVPFFGCPC